jgi:membrane carboxypeptidase/penicillin-binding protein PbpC
LAMVGSRNYFDEEIDGNVNLTTSLRQPGSSIKPLNYALGVLKGYPASTMFLDVPTCFTAAGQPGAYCPKNYDGSFHGVVQMRYALANSYNIPAVKMLALNGIKDFIATASAMGITTFGDSSNYGLSLTLGGGEVKMVDMATAFGVLANSGIRIDLNPIIKIESYTGEVLEEHDHQNNPPAGKRVLPPEVTFIISNILSDNGARMSAFGPSSSLVIPGKTVSVKTGTTDDVKDNWTIGYTPEFLTVVWTGNNDNSKMNQWYVSGVTGAAPIWNDVMSYLLKDREDVIPAKPQAVIGANVCAYKQNDEDQATCEGRYEYYIKGTENNQLFGKIEKRNTWINKDTNRPPLEGETENLELQEKLMADDMFSIDYCIDCPHDGEKAKIVILEQLYERLKQKDKSIRQENSIAPNTN